VKSYTLVDAQVSLALPMSRSTQVTLSVQNLLTFATGEDGEAVDVIGGRHREMVGAPEIGSLLLLRVRQTF
jgi:hypothetical protein